MSENLSSPTPLHHVHIRCDHGYTALYQTAHGECEFTFLTSGTQAAETV
jgi:hypothetical protein